MRKCFVSVSLVVVSLGLFLSEYRVEALAGNLDVPSLGFPSEMNKTTREQIMAAIVDKSYQFIDGRFVNAFTTLRYGGEMKGLNRFLEKLAECEGMKVVITYSKSLSGEVATWLLRHNGWVEARQLVVSINTDAPKFDKTKLEIPKQVLVQ
jgi:hypothetical protein